MKKPDITPIKWKFVEDGFRFRILIDSDELFEEVARVDCGLVPAENSPYRSEAQAIVTAVNNTYHKGIDPEAVEDMKEALMAAYRIRELWVPDMNTVPVEHEGEAESLLQMKRQIEEALKKAGVNLNEKAE